MTANTLLDGLVVYLAANDRWSLRLDEAAVADGKEAAAALLARGLASPDDLDVVDAYLFEVDTSDGAARPVSVREQIRMAGPTVRKDLGKQAEGLC